MYIIYTPCVFFKAFSLETDIQWAVLWVHFALFVHKPDTTTWLHHKISSLSAGNSLSPQFPWHRLTKHGTIERKNSSYDIFSAALGSWKLNDFLLSFSFLSGRSNTLSKSGFLVGFLSLGFLPLDFGLSNWSSKVALYLRNCSIQHGSIELRDPLHAI